MNQNNWGYIGRLTKDPEISYTQNNKKKARFGLAVDMGKDASGNKITDFFDITAWNAQADFLERYTHKGDLISAQGFSRNNRWTDQQGNKRVVLEQIATTVLLLIHANKDNQQSGNQYQQTQNVAQNGYNRDPRYEYAQEDDWSNTDDFVVDDDSLPF